MPRGRKDSRTVRRRHRLGRELLVQIPGPSRLFDAEACCAICKALGSIGWQRCRSLESVKASLSVPRIGLASQAEYFAIVVFVPSCPWFRDGRWTVSGAVSALFARTLRAEGYGSAFRSIRRGMTDEVRALGSPLVVIGGDQLYGCVLVHFRNSIRLVGVRWCQARNSMGLPATEAAACWVARRSPLAVCKAHDTHYRARCSTFRPGCGISRAGTS